MQVSSNEFDEAMKKPFRNRGYIRISIGVVNSDAQNNAQLKNTKLTYFANSKKPFDGYEVGKVYAMPEQDFTSVDGQMYVERCTIFGGSFNFTATSVNCPPLAIVEPVLNICTSLSLSNDNATLFISVNHVLNIVLFENLLVRHCGDVN